MRVLQTVGRMNRGGIETWLMHILRHIDKESFQIDFLVHTDEESHYDQEILSLGSQVIKCPREADYLPNLYRAVRDGRYDIVHSHNQYFCSVILGVCAMIGTPTRIAHSHTVNSPKKPDPMRQAYYSTSRSAIHRFATHRLAASGVAAEALFGGDWRADPHCKVLYCGIDLEPFGLPLPNGLRASLGLPEDAFVIGHVGRFREEKNHAFLIEVAARFFEHEPNAYLLLVGDGPLREATEQHAKDLGIRDHVVFAESRSDVPDLMRGAMDMFVLPSFYEALPLVLLEAQAAGLPCLISDVVCTETDTVDGLVERLCLSQSADEWARAIQHRRQRPVIPQPEALAIMEQSHFDIEASLANLEAVYCGTKTR
jgi:glycosyltransferase involved in cell wall biosynthesis